MELIDNVNHTLKEDLQKNIHGGSKLSVAAACFSIYAFQELKKELAGVKELRFIFTSPTFVNEKSQKESREFYIPRISREQSLYGTEFEVKLRNELTQKAIAKECADWIRKKAVFKSNITEDQMLGFITVDDSTYMPIRGFTTVDLGCERGNNAYYPVQKTESHENAKYFLKLFEQLWNDKKRLQEVTDIVIENISVAYRENAPEYIYFVALYNIFKEFLDDVSEDEFPNEARSEKIKFAEMSRIIEERTAKEREGLLKLFEVIRESKTANLGIVNYSNGKISTPYGVDVAFDRKLVTQVLRKAKYIKEGSFNETDGNPVIRVTGNIDLAEEVPVPEGNPDETHPYIQRQLAEKLNISTQDLYALIWYYKMKEAKKYHLGITVSRSSVTHKFSEFAFQFLQEKLKELEQNPEDFDKIRAAYRNRNRK